MKSNRIIKVLNSDPALQNILSQELSISKITAQLLINRGVKTAQEAAKFLKVSLDDLLDPFSFTQMKQATEIVEKARAGRQKVMIFGDYDADGISSTALLKNSLKSLGIEAAHYLPHRVNEGYGLNQNAVSMIIEQKYGLLITVDCGTNDFEQIQHLRSHGVEVIVTDHHELSNTKIPPASAILNPKLAACNYKYRDLAGVGVSYKFAQALCGKRLEEELDLVALGTVADLVPLTGENRIIVKQGLFQLSNGGRVGFEALLENSGIKGKKVTSTSISFMLGPRINASGRMFNADLALDLLLCQERDQAAVFAGQLNSYNRKRQQVESKILEEAQNLIDMEINFKEHKVIVVAKEGWHQGVLGVVASKLADKFYRPAVVISLNDGHCKGSARSIKNFHLFEALCSCSDLLERFGGHTHAAGLTITRDNVKDFMNRLNDVAKERLSFEDLIPSLEVDMEAGLSEINEQIISEIEALQPFGAGNPEPLFITRGLKLKGQGRIMARDSLKFWVTDGKTTTQAIGFGMGYLYPNIMASGGFDLVYSPKIDSWNGNNSLILEIKDVLFNRG